MNNVISGKNDEDSKRYYNGSSITFRISSICGKGGKNKNIIIIMNNVIERNIRQYFYSYLIRLNRGHSKCLILNLLFKCYININRVYVNVKLLCSALYFKHQF